MVSRAGAACAFVLVLAICGCCEPERGVVTLEFLRHRPDESTTIAVLPCVSSEVDMDYPVALRKAAVERLEARAYDVMPLEECDAKLREYGITEAAQLKEVDCRELGEMLGVEFVLYGELAYVDVPSPITVLVSALGHVAAQSRCNISFRLVHVASGDVPWEGVCDRGVDAWSGGWCIRMAAWRAMSTFPRCGQRYRTIYDRR